MTAWAHHQDITEIFCNIDDFCQVYEACLAQLLLPESSGQALPKSRMSLSEVMTVLVGFHGARYRTFKDFYILHVQRYWHKAMPNLVSYNRFVELMSSALVALCCYFHFCCRGRNTGISFIDSTPIKVCRKERAKRHEVFAGLAEWGKNCFGWYYGFKLHLVINDHGELLSFMLTPANTDDRAVTPDLLDTIVGKVFGDKGYISNKLFKQLLAKGTQLVTTVKKNMKNQLMTMEDKLWLKKRRLIETVNDQLKNLYMIEHTRHRKVTNCMVNLVAGLIAYTYQSDKPSASIDYNLYHQPI